MRRSIEETAAEINTWQRLTHALRRDWEQTKADLRLHAAGHDLQQNIKDTVRQVVGTEGIPSLDIPNASENETLFGDFTGAFNDDLEVSNDDREVDIAVDDPLAGDVPPLSGVDERYRATVGRVFSDLAVTYLGEGRNSTRD
jgi:hypothetical protein